MATITGSEPRELEERLVAGLRRGDSACFELMVRTYGGQMLSVANRYLKNEADAKDCVQEAYLSAFKNGQSFEGRSTVKSWLYRIVVNHALMRLRVLSRRPEVALESVGPQFDQYGMRVSQSSDASESFADQSDSNLDDQNLVRIAISQLPENIRNLLILRDIQGYSTSETAKLLGKTDGAVKTGLHRARDVLKTLIEQTTFEQKAFEKKLGQNDERS